MYKWSINAFTNNTPSAVSLLNCDNIFAAADVGQPETDTAETLFLKTNINDLEISLFSFDTLQISRY
jgi:hypothetical protein